jgi:hypothetical protein
MNKGYSFVNGDLLANTFGVGVAVALMAMEVLFTGHRSAT